MPFRYQVQVNYLNNGFNRILGHGKEGWHTTSGHDSTACWFNSETEAREAVTSARSALLAQKVAAFSMQVNRISSPDPPYTGPHLTLWDRITGDEDEDAF